MSAPKTSCKSAVRACEQLHAGVALVRPLVALRRQATTFGIAIGLSLSAATFSAACTNRAHETPMHAELGLHARTLHILAQSIRASDDVAVAHGGDKSDTSSCCINPCGGKPNQGDRA